jgi:hypothetical protein
MKDQAQLVTNPSANERADMPPPRPDRLRRMWQNVKAVLSEPEGSRRAARADNGVFQPPKY